MPRKRDIKQFEQACREAGLAEPAQYAASKALHNEKKASGTKEHMPYKELVAWLREWKEG